MKRLLKYLFAVLIIAVILNIPQTTRYGVDGRLYVKKIPVYAKLCGYLYRDWCYRDLAREITAGEKGQERKALVILKWAGENIRFGVPDGLKLVDDHPLNIIIRQYGAGDQLEDVFTILCSYAGMKAGMEKCYKPGSGNYIVLSFVRADGRWLVFDAKNGRYFLNNSGNVASVEDYLNGRIALSPEDETRYGAFLNGLKNIDPASFTRADEQMPLKRIPARIKRFFRGI